MLDHDITIPAGWQTAWLQRTLPALHCYVAAVSYALSLSIIALGLVGFIAIRRSTKRLKDASTNRQSTFAAMNKKLLKVTKGHFYVANIYMLNVLVITMVDAVICAITLKDDASSDPTAWTRTLLLEIAVYCVYLLLIFAATFIFVPLIQMLLVTWLLSRLNNTYGKNVLVDFIPEARFFSTHIAQIWCMMCYFVVSWWAPSDNNSIWRYVILQACFGSAITWLEASYAFNFHVDRLQDNELQAPNGGVREIICLFKKTVLAVHGRSGPPATLPRYESVAQADEKTLSKEEKEFR